MTAEATAMTSIDLDRCRRGMQNLVISGGHPRGALIEEAIRAIQTDPANAFMAEYFGIKNYASFGDQREDHRYGYGPRHGAIVFSIGRSDRARQTQVALGADEIYLLEAARDFKVIEVPDWEARNHGHPLLLGLCAAIRVRDNYASRIRLIETQLFAASVVWHDGTP